MRRYVIQFALLDDTLNKGKTQWYRSYAAPACYTRRGIRKHWWRLVNMDFVGQPVVYRIYDNLKDEVVEP